MAVGEGEIEPVAIKNFLRNIRANHGCALGLDVLHMGRDPGKIYKVLG